MTDRGRIWATIVYEESATEDWMKRLEDLLIPCYISPLHDKDDVKPHYHVMMLFDGQKSRKQVTELFKSFGGIGCEYVQSKSAYLAYLCHLKSEGKYKYPIEDVKTLNGAVDYQRAIEDISADRYELMNEIIAWCSENTVCFATLVDYARVERKDWFKVLVSGNSHLIWEYIKSKAWHDSQV